MHRIVVTTDFAGELKEMSQHDPVARTITHTEEEYAIAVAKVMLFRYVYAKMLEVGFRIVRRGSPLDGGNQTAYVTQAEFEERLPRLAEIEHDIWLREYMLRGYDWAAVTNEDLLLHPDVALFDDVPTADKEGV